MPRKPAIDRKAEIVATVLRLADDVGPDRLTTQAVADALGLTQPAIFRHFATKQLLWKAVGDAITASMTEAWKTAVADKRGPEQRLAALIRVQLRHIEANPAIPAILHSRELQAENAELRQNFRALMMRFQGLLLAELAEARDTGAFRVDLLPQDCAILLISLVQGLAIRWALGSRDFALEQEGGRLAAEQLKLFRTVSAKEVST